MKPWVIALGVGGLGLVSGCRKVADPVPVAAEERGSESGDERQERGAEAAQELVRTLGGQLKKALSEGDAVSAVGFCQQAALPFTVQASERFSGLKVGRTTLRVRNPANAPDEVDREVLRELEAALAAGHSPQPVWREERGEERYYQPLLTQELCLKCHGEPESFSPELREVLARAYPQDAATGYRVGELRGVVRVRFAQP